MQVELTVTTHVQAELKEKAVVHLIIKHIPNAKAPREDSATSSTLPAAGVEVVAAAAAGEVVVVVVVALATASAAVVIVGSSRQRGASHYVTP